MRLFVSLAWPVGWCFTFMRGTAISTNNFHISDVSMNGSNVAFGSSGAVNQTLNTTAATNRGQLMQDLSRAGLSPAQIEALSDALDQDGEVEDAPGPEVQSWLDEVRQQVTSTVVTTVWALVTAHLGLPAAN
ncbi:hypothetical protein [Nocardia amamiensis]|uniref:hypothetical protein n=1 Tax=Nocardia amamiensis TaxID=404578 RepID=UPI0008339C33|nr:hypothetical protein [Nocardia amamiensis]